jgi:hypothetical protein
MIFSGYLCLLLEKSMQMNDKDRSYDEVLDLLETYGIDRILEDSQTDMPSVLIVLDELGFVELEMYEDDNSG